MEVEKAFKRLLIKNPFYGLFCLSLPKVVTRKHPTMCVSKQGISCQLNINPDFWEQHTDDEQISLLMHELGHICFQHMFMSDSFADSKMFNVAADCEVNSYIENLPKDCCTPEWLSQKIGKQLEKGLGTKKYYEAIQDYLNQQQAQQQSQQQSSQQGQQQRSSNNNQQASPSSPQKQKRNLFDGLSKMEKKCCVLRRYKKWSISKIARKLSITEKQVKDNIKNGNKAIRQKLMSHGL